MNKGMKVAVSIPDDLFEEADRLAQRTGASRSALYARALSNYVQTHLPDETTAALDAVIAEIGQEDDSFVRAAARRTLDRADW